MEAYRSRGILRLHPVERGPRQPIDDRRLAQALEMFNKGEGGFKDRDLYVWCANASDGILTAHPTNKGKELRDIEGKEGAPFGQDIMKKAAEGTIKEVTYWWPRPGSDKPMEKTTFYTKAGDHICGVGYYKE
jgi:cache domain-containing protein